MTQPQEQSSPARPGFSDHIRAAIRRICKDVRLWIIPVILVIRFVPDVRVFLGLPVAIGVIFVFLITKQNRRKSESTQGSIPESGQR